MWIWMTGGRQIREGVTLWVFERAVYSVLISGFDHGKEA